MDIGLAGFDAATGVVVRQDQRRSAVVQRAQHHLARINRGLRERAAKQLLQHDQAVLAVQKQYGKHLVAQVRQVHLQVLAHGLGAVENLALAQLLRGGAARQLHHGQDFGLLGRAQALDARQRLHAAGGEQARQTALAIKQVLRQLQHATPGQASTQQNSQQLGVGQGGRPACEQFFARQAVGGQILEWHQTNIPQRV